MVRRCKDAAGQKEASGSGRLMKCRWVLTWKTIPPGEQEKAKKKRLAEGAGKTAIAEGGTYKAKARIVLIGFQHPDLATNKLKTSLPVVSYVGKTLILLMASIHQWTIESIDAVSAFRQSEASEEQNRLWCVGVGELAKAVGALRPSDAVRILETFYGFTSGPRTFWIDSKGKLEDSADALRILGDQCVWIFVEAAALYGICGSHVEDFLIAGSHKNPSWMATREKIREIYKWGAVNGGSFRFAGIIYAQPSDFTV